MIIVMKPTAKEQDVEQISDVLKQQLPLSASLGIKQS